MKDLRPFRASSALWHTRMRYLCLALAGSMLLFACKKTTLQGRSIGTLPNANFQASEVNLLANGSFATLAGTNIFKNWTIYATNKGAITSTKDGIQFSGNASGHYYVAQYVNVTASSFYKLSITADYALKDYSACGIYVFDTTLQTMLGKFEKAYSSATSDTWQFIFNSGTHTAVSVVVGFLAGINGAVKFSNANMQEYAYQPTISNSDFAAHLNQRFPLTFTAQLFDSSISYLGDYVNDVLLSNIMFQQDSGENTLLDGFIGADSAYTYFNQYRHRPDQIRDGYCQRSALSLGEILTNEFHIPVRQMFMNFDGVGKHQFLEYWNPFSARWIIIDPCFNTQYKRNNILLGAADFTRAEAPSLMIRFGTHYYYDTLDELVDLWQGYDELDIQGFYTMTYPF